MVILSLLEAVSQPIYLKWAGMGFKQTETSSQHTQMIAFDDLHIVLRKEFTV